MRRPGFTLVEILVVIAIIGILAGLTSSVYSASMRRAKEPVDISNMRQIYIGISLYEEDEGMSPDVLTQTLPYVKDSRVFSSPVDLHRKPVQGSSWSATPFMSCTKKLSPHKVSFAYLKTFPPKDTDEIGWLEYRSRSEVGLIASPWSGKVIKIPNDEFFCPGFTESLLAVSAPPMDGPILRVNMDGSFFRLNSNKYKGWMGNLHDFFFNRG